MSDNLIVRRRGLGKGSFDGMRPLFPDGMVDLLRCDQIPPESRYDQVIRWGWTGSLGFSPSMVVNDASAIHRVNDKSNARLHLMGLGIQVPTTYTYIPSVMPEHGLIIRPRFHAQGKKLWHYTNWEDAQRKFALLSAAGLDPYCSDYLPKNREYRVYVIQGRVAAVAEKIVRDPRVLAWNHAQGSTFNNIRWESWPISGCKVAVKAALALKIDFVGVDVMEYNGQAYVLEGNSAPSLTTPYSQKVFAKVFGYMLALHSKDPIPIESFSSWRTIIHPALPEVF